MICAFMNFISLAKDYAERHHYEISGKSAMPSCGQMTCGFFYYSIVIFLRMQTLLLFLIMTHYWFFIFFITAIFLNAIMAFSTLRTPFSKTVWTSFCSVLSPTCYMSKFKIPTLRHPGENFHRFYLWNAIGYFSLSMTGSLLINVLLYQEKSITDFISDDVPFLKAAKCWKEGDCTNIHLASSVAVFSAFLQILMIWAQNIVCPSMHGTENLELEYLV